MFIAGQILKGLVEHSVYLNAAHDILGAIFKIVRILYGGVSQSVPVINYLSDLKAGRQGKIEIDNRISHCPGPAREEVCGSPYIEGSRAVQIPGRLQGPAAPPSNL